MRRYVWAVMAACAARPNSGDSTLGATMNRVSGGVRVCECGKHFVMVPVMPVMPVMHRMSVTSVMTTMNAMTAKIMSVTGFTHVMLVTVLVLFSRVEGAGMHSERDGIVEHIESESSEPRVERLKPLEGMADEATRALRHAVWDEEVTPVISGLGGLSATEALRLLVEPIPLAPRSAWHALRAGCTGSAPSDAMLDAARALLIREAVLASLDDNVKIPPSVLYCVVDALPLPVRHPGATDPVISNVARLEKRERLVGASRSDAIALCAELPEQRARALAWIVRLDALYAALLARADGSEGRAIVRVSRATRLANAGWDPDRDSSIDRPSERTSTATSTSVSPAAPSSHKPIDRVLRDIRLARKESPTCESLHRALRIIQPSAVMIVSNVVIDAHDQLGVGRQIVALEEQRIEAWLRESGVAYAGRAGNASSDASGVGTQPPTRPRSKRLRDAPFGVKPLR